MFLRGANVEITFRKLAPFVQVKSAKFCMKQICGDVKGHEDVVPES